jgi:hypothetical protein
MSNALYGKGKEKLLSGAIDLTSATIKAALVKSAYTVNLATHEFYSDLGANVLNTPQTLGSKTVTLGVFDAADITYSAVTVGDTGLALVIYKDTGTGSTSPLLAYIDTITGFPISTNGGDITIQWDNGASKIFAL